MSALQVIEIMAGSNAQGEPVIERLQVRVQDDDSCQLVKSPAFVRGIASGDRIKFNPQTGQFELQQRSGNLCIRVYSKSDTADIVEGLTAELEKLGAELDTETPRLLVYTIHVSCGFEAIEAILNRHMTADSAWTYGNVYDPNDGQTPLNWWQSLLKPQ